MIYEPIIWRPSHANANAIRCSHSDAKNFASCWPVRGMNRTDIRHWRREIVTDYRNKSVHSNNTTQRPYEKRLNQELQHDDQHRTVSSFRICVIMGVGRAAVMSAQFSFITNDGAITITGDTGPGGVVVIPSSTNGYPLILNNGPGFNFQADGCSFTISWATNPSVIVQACTNLANPIWTPVTTNTLTGGTSYFSDSQWTNYPGRFYRIRLP